LLDVRDRPEPDFVIGGADDPYLLRWYLIQQNRLFNIYLHEVRRSDDDRALHDHPWPNVSFLLRGAYVEHRIRAGGIEARRTFTAGALKFRLPWAAHRVELLEDARGARWCWSLFITGPWCRSWGFHCPNGWRDWRDFTNTADGGSTTGRGCA
jgi:hypothetical protein